MGQLARVLCIFDTCIVYIVLIWVSHNSIMEVGSNAEVGFSSFEAQFENKRTIPFPEGNVDVVDVAPPNVSDLPVLLAPGWSENQDTYKNR